MTIHLMAPQDQTKWPKIWHHCYNIWKTSPYKIKMWYDEDLDQLLKEDDKEFFDILNTLPPIYKWDYVRYIILEKFGGAYFDMDVEIVDGSFLNKFNPEKIYLMEGSSSSYLENSIMVSYQSRRDDSLWYSVKKYAQRHLLNNLDDCQQERFVVNYIGADLLSKFFLIHSPKFKAKYEILSYHQFASLTNEIVYTRHYNTSKWLNPLI